VPLTLAGRLKVKPHGLEVLEALKIAYDSDHQIASTIKTTLSATWSELGEGAHQQAATAMKGWGCHIDSDVKLGTKVLVLRHDHHFHCT
jgi:hypothetical protein